MGRVKDVELFTLIRDYLTIYLPVQRKSSVHTITDYRISLNQLLEYVADKNNISYTNVTFEMLGRDAVNSFLDYLTEEKKLAASTRNNRLAAIKSFLSYASAMKPEYIIVMNDISQIKTQRDDPFSKVDYMTEAAVQALFSAPDIHTRIGLRDLFFMIIMYDTGGRIQEILDIKVCHIQLGKSPCIQLHGKGNKTRIVPLMENTIAHLKNYMQVFHEKETWESQQYLFYMVHGSVKTQICDDTIRERMKIYADIARKTCADVPDRVHPHLWRHSRAMHLYQHGMDLTLISQWLGHKQFTTTLVYAHADTEAKRIAIEKAMGGNKATENTSCTYKLDDDDLIKRLYGLK